MIVFKWSFLIFIMMLSVGNVNATDVNYGASVNVASYDNLNLEPEILNPPEEESASLIAALSIAQDSASITANLDSTYEKLFYKSDLNDDQNILNLVADGLWRIKPGLFEWYLSEVFTQTAIDVLEADTLNNRQDTSIFTTGPNMQFRLAPQNTIDLEFRFQKSRFEIDNTSNSRLIGRSSFTHRVNPNLNLLINYDNEKVNYTERITNSNFYRNDFFISAQYTKARNQYEVELGSTNINFENEGSDDQDIARYKVAWIHQHNRNSSTSLLINRSVEDTATNLNNGLVNANDPVVNASNLDLFLNEAIHIVYNTVFSQGNLIIEPYINKIKYNDQLELNTHETGLLVLGSLQLSGRSSLSFDLQYLESDYDNIQPKRIDEDTIYRLLYTYRIGRHLNLSFDSTRQVRDSTFADQSYEDLRFLLTLEYTSR